jgi:hypothetical protein
MPAQCEIQKAGTAVYSKNDQNWHFSSKHQRLRVFCSGPRVDLFRTLSQIQGAWLRHALFAVAAPSVGCAFAFREKSDKI